MSKSILYAANTNSQTVVSGGTTVNFGNIVRKYGCNCNLSGGNPTVTGAGYYDIDTNFTFTAGGAGTVVFTLYINGVSVPGASASVTTVADTIYSVSIPSMVRAYCCNPSTITVVASGVAGTINNAAIVVEKE